MLSANDWKGRLMKPSTPSTFFPMAILVASLLAPLGGAVKPRSSLIQFHRVLIGAAILFCGGFAAYTFALASREGGGWLWALGAVFALFAVGFTIYLWNLSRVLGYRDD